MNARALLVMLLIAACGGSSAPPAAEDARRAASTIDAARDDAPPDRPARVLSTTGTAERRTATGWAPLAAGDVLMPNESIRTGGGGGAEIELPGMVTVTLAERSEITMLDLSRSVAELLLDEGRLSAASPAGAKIRIETRNSGAIAESDGGRFSMLDRGGQVAVTVEEGSVAVSARGTRVEVPAGKQTIVAPDAAPGEPQAIPPTLFLKVRRLAGSRISGETVAGAVISINGVVSTAGADGRFHEAVPALRGDDVIIVEVEDVQGRRAQHVLRKTAVDRKPPPVETTVEWR